MKNFFEKFELNNIHVGVFNSDYQSVRDGMLYLDDEYNLVFSMKNGVNVYIDKDVMAYYSDSDERVWYIKSSVKDKVFRKSLVYIDDPVNGVFPDEGGFLFSEKGVACFESDCGEVYRLIPSKYVSLIDRQ